MTQHRIRLDDLLGRSVGVQWFEGVALVLAICRELQGGPHSGFPDTRDVFVRADGSVEVLAAATGKPLSAAGHLLAQMLSDDVPVRLRLVVTQATASDAAYGDLEQFSEALAYFERPDGAGTLRGLYERASHAPATAGAPRLGAAAHPEDVPSEPTESSSGARQSRVRVYEAEQPAQRQKGISRSAVIGPIVAVVLCASAWSVSMVLSRSGSAGSGEAGTAAEATGPIAGEELLENAASRKGKARPSDTPGTRPAKQPEASEEAARTSAPGARAAAGQPGAAATRTVPQALALARTAPVAAPTAAAAADPIPVVSSSPTSEHPAGRLYSADDAGVKLPRHVYPKVPEEPPAPVTHAGDRTILDLVIAADGLVERVKLRTAPRDVHEFMLVSAAKAWRFEPATVGGRPVRFLYSMPISRD